MSQAKHIIAKLLQSVFSYAEGSGMDQTKIDKIQDLCDEILSIVNGSLRVVTAPDVTSVDADRRDRRRKKHRDETKQPEHVEPSSTDTSEPVTEPETESTESVAPAKRGRKKKAETSS